MENQEERGANMIGGPEVRRKMSEFSSQSNAYMIGLAGGTADAFFENGVHGQVHVWRIILKFC